MIGNGQDEFCPSARFSLFSYRPAVHIHHFLNEKQAEASAAASTEPLLEELAFVLSRDAYTVILINQPQPVRVCLLTINFYGGGFYAVFFCVIYKIVEHLPEK